MWVIICYITYVRLTKKYQFVWPKYLFLCKCVNCACVSRLCLLSFWSCLIPVIRWAGDGDNNRFYVWWWRHHKEVAICRAIKPISNNTNNINKKNGKMRKLPYIVADRTSPTSCLIFFAFLVIYLQTCSSYR